MRDKKTNNYLNQSLVDKMLYSLAQEMLLAQENTAESCLLASGAIRSVDGRWAGATLGRDPQG